MQQQQEEQLPMMLQSPPTQPVYDGRDERNGAGILPLLAPFLSGENGRQVTERRFLWSVLLGVAVAAFIIVLIGGYVFNWKWTGFSNNTLWDWWQLLIWPVTVAFVGFLFNRQQSETSLARAHLPPWPIIARVRADNTASLRIAERAGLVRRPDLDTEHIVLALGSMPSADQLNPD